MWLLQEATKSASLHHFPKDALTKGEEAKNTVLEKKLLKCKKKVNIWS